MVLHKANYLSLFKIPTHQIQAYGSLTTSIGYTQCNSSIDALQRCFKGKSNKQIPMKTIAHRYLSVVKPRPDPTKKTYKLRSKKLKSYDWSLPSETILFHSIYNHSHSYSFHASQVNVRIVYLETFTSLWSS